jgi:hypothetical protein
MGELAEEGVAGGGRGQGGRHGSRQRDAEDASIIRFVNQVLRDAIELRASDIHLEPFEHEFQIRYRVDGVLQDSRAGADQTLSARHRLARQDSQPPQHRRETVAAGRAHQNPARRQRGGHPRLGDSDVARRSGGAAFVAPELHAARHGRDRAWTRAN